MHPILFRIGSFEIYSYGVVLVIALYLSIYLLRIEAYSSSSRAGKKGIDSQTLNQRNLGSGQIILDIALLVIVSGILGGKIAYIIFNLPLYIQNPSDITLWRAGFIFYGGFFLSILTVFFYTKKKKLSFLSIADFLIPYVALAEAIGRIGCYLNGCCYGKPTDLPWGKIFPLISPAGYHYGALKLHPTQLYSSLFLFILFLILKKIREHQKSEGETFLSYLLFYPAFRFFLEFLRGDGLGLAFHHLTAFQIICIGVVTISLAILIMKLKKLKIKD